MAASYTETAKTVALGNVAVTNATDLMLLSLADSPTAAARAEYSLGLPDGSTVKVADGQPVRLPAPITGNVSVSASLLGTEAASPVLFPGTQLVSGQVSETADHVSRAIPAGNNARVRVIFERPDPGRRQRRGGRLGRRCRRHLPGRGLPVQQGYGRWLDGNDARTGLHQRGDGQGQADARQQQRRPAPRAQPARHRPVTGEPCLKSSSPLEPAVAAPRQQPGRRRDPYPGRLHGARSEDSRPGHILTSDDLTLDSVQELVGAIKAARTEIGAVNALVASQLAAQNTAINAQLTAQNDARGAAARCALGARLCRSVRRNHAQHQPDRFPSPNTWPR